MEVSSMDESAKTSLLLYVKKWYGTKFRSPVQRNKRVVTFAAS
jgi:hypothetical protein